MKYLVLLLAPVHGDIFLGLPELYLEQLGGGVTGPVHTIPYFALSNLTKPHRTAPSMDPPTLAGPGTAGSRRCQAHTARFSTVLTWGEEVEVTKVDR